MESPNESLPLPSSPRQLDKLISEEEFDNLMSTEYRLTKLITPDLITYDPAIFEQKVEDGKVPTGRPSTYSIEEKIRACIVHTCTGSMSKTEHITGIPTNTLLHWRKNSDWWMVIRTEVEKIRNDLLVAKLDEVIEHATDQMLDRIINGDEVYNHTTGEKTRVKVKLTDLANAGLKVAQEKRDELRGMEGISSSKKDVQEYLRKLAGAFEDLTRKIEQKKDGEVLDGEFKEVSN